MGPAPLGAYLRAMTTYTTPHFATGVSDGTTRPQSTAARARPASAAPYRTAGVTNEAALMQDGMTPDWQPGASKGVPKAAIGALGAALIGGAALAFVLMAPTDKVVKQTMPDPIAQANAGNGAPAHKTSSDADAAVGEMDKQAPAAGNATPATAATTGADAQKTAEAPAPDATPAAAAVAPAPAPAVTPKAAPAARPVKAKAVPTATKAAPEPVQQPAPTVTPDAPVTPAVTPPADVQQPAMQQTPETSTVTPSTPAPAPTPDATPTPAPAQ